MAKKKIKGKKIITRKKRMRVKVKRAINRYNHIYRFVKGYLTENGKNSSRKDILDEYHRIKNSCKGIPLDRLQDCVEVNMEKNEKRHMPQYLKVFDWWRFETELTDSNDYFKPSDIITMDLSAIDEDSITFPYSELTGKYKEAYIIINPAIQSMKRDGRLSKTGSPVPQFYISKEDKGDYAWSFMDLPSGEEEDTEQEIEKEVPTITATKKETKASIEKEKRKTLKEKQKTYKASEKAAIAKTKLEKEKQKTFTKKVKMADKALQLKKAGFTKKEIFRILGV